MGWFEKFKGNLARQSKPQFRHRALDAMPLKMAGKEVKSTLFFIR